MDENDLCFLGGTPHGLMDVFACGAPELDALYDQDVNAGVGEGKTYEIRKFLRPGKNERCRNAAGIP